MAEEKMKEFGGPVTIEAHFRIDGKRVEVKVTFPAAVTADIGMEKLTIAANRAIVTAESKESKVEKVRKGQAPA